MLFCPPPALVLSLDVNPKGKFRWRIFLYYAHIVWKETSSANLIPMGAQSLVLPSNFHGGVSSRQAKKTNFLTTSSVSVSSRNDSRRLVYLRSISALRSAFSTAKRNLGCRNIVEKAEFSGNFEIEEDKPKAEVRRKNLAVFVSGGGSNFRAIYEAILNGSVHGDIVVLVTNKHDCGGAAYARDKGIPVIVFPRRNGSQEPYSAEDLVTSLRSFKADFILLAGYLKLIPSELVKAYPKSILNIHPSLLPAFGGKGYYGMKVHKAVITSGARYSGPTIHYVDEQYDTGRIIAQRAVPVLATDTAEELAARVLHEEHKLYVDVTAALCDDRIIWRNDGVPLIRSKENPQVYS